MKLLLLLTAVLISLEQARGLWGENKDRILLSEVNSITLEKGKMTNGRRSSPVPQLSCVGGSAGCHAFQPIVVQCYNRGSDGYDAQWECKTDMDATYRFGRIQVSCEGYDNPDDRYILRGSCGLEYEIDLTEEGRRGNHHHDNSHDKHYSGTTSIGGKIIQMVIVVTIFYFIFKCCRFGNRQVQPYSGYSTDGTASGMGTGHGTSGGGGGGGGGGWGGWTGGFATGGLLGYLFGNRGAGYGGGGYGRGYGGGGYGGGGYGGGSMWGASPRYGGSHRSSGWSSSSRSSSGSSSGSRSTSGFGGTSRR